MLLLLPSPTSWYMGHASCDVCMQGDYLLEMFALGRLAVYIGTGAEGLAIPMRRLKSVIRRYSDAENLLLASPYGRLSKYGSLDSLAAW